MATFGQASGVVRFLSALGVCVSGRRGAERSEQSEDGTPAARDPSEARGTPSGDTTRENFHRSADELYEPRISFHDQER
jgi:hypothetical protein